MVAKVPSYGSIRIEFAFWLQKYNFIHAFQITVCAASEHIDYSFHFQFHVPHNRSHPFFRESNCFCSRNRTDSTWIAAAPELMRSAPFLSHGKPQHYLRNELIRLNFCNTIHDDIIHSFQLIVDEFIFCFAGCWIALYRGSSQLCNHSVHWNKPFQIFVQTIRGAQWTQSVQMFQ